MPMPKYLRNLDGTAGKPRLSEGTMLSEGPVNDCNIFDDGVPITADPIGVDASGHTTWVIATGAPSGTFTATEASATGLTCT